MDKIGEEMEYIVNFDKNWHTKKLAILVVVLSS